MGRDISPHAHPHSASPVQSFKNPSRSLDESNKHCVLYNLYIIANCEQHPFLTKYSDSVTGRLYRATYKCNAGISHIFCLIIILITCCTCNSWLSGWHIPLHALRQSRYNSKLHLLCSTDVTMDTNTILLHYYFNRDSSMCVI